VSEKRGQRRPHRRVARRPRHTRARAPPRG